MSKKPNKKSPQRRYDGPMTGGMKFFLAGCVAELYLLIIRRFYINGTLDQVLAWYSYLKIFAAVGAVVAIVGAVLAFVWKQDKKRREIAWYVLGGGLFLGIASAAVAWNMNALSILTALVPVVLVLDVLWSLFDHDSALSLTALAGGFVAAWLCRHGAGGLSGLAVKGAVVLFVAALALLAAALRGGKLGSFISADAHKTIFVSCAIAAVGAAASLVSAAIAYYAMWVLAAVIFCMAVYYTVRQL